MATGQEVIKRAEQLQLGYKLMVKKTRELKADLSNLDAKPPAHILDSMHRTLFHLETHADELFSDLEKLR